MKKILTLILVVMMVAILGVTVFADEIAVTDEAKFDKVVESITNSTLWVTIGTVLSAVVACVATFIKGFNAVKLLIKDKADASAITEALQNTSTELSTVFNSKLADIEQRLKDAGDNEKMLTTMLTIFMTNANINPNAKAGILKYLSGIKEISGKIPDIVDKANEMIAKADEAEVKVPTPALDAITEEKTESEMVLG